jgi:hypothetical protein
MSTDCCANGIQWVCQTYNLNCNDVLHAYNRRNIPSYKNYDIDHDKCVARLKRDIEWEQCSRSRKKEHFCLTHYKQFVEGSLRFGYFKEDDSHLSSLQQTKRSNVVKTDEEKRRTISLEIVTLKNVDYLYDPATCYVYDFHSKQKKGKLDSSGSIIPFKKG